MGTSYNCEASLWRIQYNYKIIVTFLNGRCCWILCPRAPCLRIQLIFRAREIWNSFASFNTPTTPATTLLPICLRSDDRRLFALFSWLLGGDGA